MSKFYKIFSLLLVACLAAMGAWAQTPVKTVEDLENGAAYSITVPEQSIYDEWYNEFAEDKGVLSGATYNPVFTLSFTVTGTYPINFDKDTAANPNIAGRVLNGVTLTCQEFGLQLFIYPIYILHNLFLFKWMIL